MIFNINKDKFVLCNHLIKNTWEERKECIRRKEEL